MGKSWENPLPEFLPRAIFDALITGGRIRPGHPRAGGNAWGKAWEADHDGKTIGKP